MILSERELEILQAAANGHNNKKIASLMNITDDTVDKHSRNITKKLGAQNMKEAVAEGFRKGIIK